MYSDVPIHHWQEPACCATCKHLKYIKGKEAHICQFWKGLIVDTHMIACKSYKPKK